MRVERQLIKPNDRNYKAVKQACVKAKVLYNQANYYLRQSFFDGEFRSWQKVDKTMKFLHKEQYNSIPNAGSQSIIKRLGANWKGFFNANSDFKKNPDRYTGRPKPPNYSKNLQTYSQPFQALKCVDNHIYFPKKLGIEPIKIISHDNQETLSKDGKISEIRFVPHGHCFWLEVIYKEDELKQKVLLNKSNYIAADLGINNLLTIVSNQTLQPLLINGKVIKSINQQYNKRVAFYRSKNKPSMIKRLTIERFNKIDDYFHKVSYFLINYCLKNDIGTIVIGKNEGWKNEINLGRVTNQKFVNIPFEKLINLIEYKAESYGIEVIIREESYTSKSDALALDKLPIFDKKTKEKHTFLGKRKKRGLYQSSIGKLINADVNGGINILRKEVGDDFVKNLIDSGCVFQPKAISFH